MKKLILLFALLTGIVTTNSLTAQTVIASGNCGANGNNLTWELTDNGVLTISGSGAMADYDYNNHPSWYSHLNSISEIIIGNAVTNIGDSAFCWCEGLTSVSIGNAVTNIGDGAFYYCHNLTSVSIGNSVTNIGNSAFYNCSDLTSVNIPNSVTNIGDDAFAVCYGLTSVTIPNSVTNIGDLAFAYCRNLISITMGNSVINIGDLAFVFCFGLTSVTIPNSVINIGTSAFAGCIGLTSVTIGNSVTNIGAGAFTFCRNLISITMGNSVINIGNSAFYNCTGLTSITCLASVPPTLDPDAFYEVPNTIPICVPSGSVAAYEASDWNYFTNIDGCAPTGISEIDKENASAALYPNPVQNTLQIQSSLTIEQLTIYDISGRVLKQIINPNQEVNVSDLAKGVYLVKLKTENGEVMRKVVKE